jgi:hypothetical protein
VQGLPAKIVEAGNSSNERDESSGNLRIGRICPVFFAVRQIPVNFGVKGLLYLAG